MARISGQDAIPSLREITLYEAANSRMSVIASFFCPNWILYALGATIALIAKRKYSRYQKMLSRINAE